MYTKLLFTTQHSSSFITHLLSISFSSSFLQPSFVRLVNKFYKKKLEPSFVRLVNKFYKKKLSHSFFFLKTLLSDHLINILITPLRFFSFIYLWEFFHSSSDFFSELFSIIVLIFVIMYFLNLCFKCYIFICFIS